MEQQHNTIESPANTASQENCPAAWVAPLQSIKMFSIAEFTQNGGNPGDDGLGTTSAS